MIRKIEYDIDNEGIISPTDKQDAGFVGEHNATSIIFKPASSLITAIKEINSLNSLYYRFEVTDGENSRFSTEPVLYGDVNQIEFNLSNAFTKVKGELTVTLIFETTGSHSTVTLFNFPAKLSLKESNSGIDGIIEEYENVSTANENIIKLHNEVTVMHDEVEDLFENNKILAAEVKTNAESVKVNTATVVATESQIKVMQEEIESNTKTTVNATKEAGEFAVNCTKLYEETAVLAQKAEAAATSAQESRIASATSEKNAKTTLTEANAILEETKSIVENKADVAYVDNAINNTINSTKNQLEGKADTTYVDNSINNLSSKTEESLNNKADISYVDDCVNNTASEIKDILSNHFALAIKNTVSGQRITVNDVSPIPHNINIKLQNDRIVDFSSVNLKTYGKNLFYPPNAYLTGINENGVTIKYLEDEACFVLNGTVTSTLATGLRNISIPNIKGTVYSISTQYVSGSFQPGSVNVVYFSANDSLSSRKNWYDCKISLGNNSTNAAVCNYNYINMFWFYLGAGSVYDNYKVKVQLEIGSTATSYQPCTVYPTVAANADGTVEGVVNISPDMTLIANTQNINIEATYIADTKLYIDNKLKQLQS